MDATLAQLLDTIYDLTARVTQLKAENAALQAANADLEIEVVTLRDQVQAEGR